MAAYLAGKYGQKTSIGASAVKLVAAQKLAKTGVKIKAAAANSTGIVYVGNDSSVTTSTGFALGSSESESFDVAWFQSAPGANGDLQDIWLIGSTTGLAVSFWYA